ncbi:tetratricopeptide repeat protein [Planktothrix rubescens]|nr:tetratricopeptide repeat protein [Planktothrix rubescens]
MNIEDIQDSVRIGIEVTVILRTGHQFSGVLTEIRETSIILRQASGTKMPLSAEAIDCIFPIQSTDLSIEITPILQSAGTTASLPTRLSTSSNLQNNLEQKNSLLPLKTNESQLESPTNNNIPRYAIEVITKIVEIETRFSTAIAQVKLEPLPPDFSTPIEIISSPSLGEKNSMLAVWNKVKEQYDNAIKNKDSQLLNRPIESCEQLIKKYPKLGCSRFNLGCIYYQQGQNHKAVEVFELAASKSKDPRVFYNLAIIVLKSEPAKSCYALHEYFKISSPSENIVAWYKFIDLSLNSGVINQLTNLFEQAIENNRENDGRLIIESAVFALKKHNQNKEAEELTASLIQHDSELAILSQMLKSMLSNLGLEATEAYLKQEQELKQAQEKAKRQDNQIKQQKEVDNLIDYAKSLAKRQLYNQAIAELRKVIEKSPENQIAQNLLTEYREADKERGLPTGSGAYPQAKRAEIIDKDLKKAEKLYRQAINENDNAENAVKDLAALLTRQNRDQEAIKILKEYLNKVSNKQSILNMLANVYQRAGKYEDEIDILKQVLTFTSYDKRSTVLKRIASSQFRLGEYQKAKETLEQAVKQNPRDETVLNLLEALREGEKTGVYTKLDALFLTQEGMGDIQTTLSSFLAFHVHQCDYSGIEASKITSKQFNEKDVEKLQQRAGEMLGTQRPRERASYYLSAAKILIDLGSKAEELLPRKYLRNFCAAMGDACITEQKHRDVARSYYAEAFLIAPDWVKQLDIKLSQYIMLYYSQTEELLKTEIPSVESCLEQALKITNKDLGTSVIEGLLYLSWLNREVGRVLINKINPNKRLRELVQNLCYQTCGEKGEPTGDDSVFLELWERGRELIRRRNQEVLDEFAFLNSIVISLDSVREQIEKVQLLGQKVRGTLDKQRLNIIQEILNSMYDYSQQQSYMEREYFKAIIQNRVSEVLEDIEKNPTKYSWELFRPYLLDLSSTIKNHFDGIQKVSEPEQLITELSIDSYTPDENSNIECQITITNENGKSPASSIKICVQPSPNNEYIVQVKHIDVSEALYGGKSVTCLIPVTVTEIAKESQVFTLYYGLSFITRRDEKKTSEDTQSIKLYSNTEFKEIKNPYATYAQGSTVENKNMFYGRDQLINVLLSSIRNASSAKSLVIYGQKRAGKSSVLYHLKQQLELPIIPVSFSIGDIIDDFSVGTFLYRIIQCIEDTFEDLNDEGYPAIEVKRPTLEELQQNSQLQFQDYMTNLCRSLKKVEEYKEATIMLLIDEFSYIYGEIMRGRIRDTFMKSWKALLEKRHFGAVLVGQDTMPQFIAHFPNEFQVAESQRISYLADDDARCLIINPILIPDTKESRYKGDAVNLLLRLTAGSPYYIQIFCNRLVEYMNRKKAIYVTDADIETIKEDLISGHNSLDDSVFDNLISAGDSSIDDIGKEDALAVLRDIANGARIQSHCDRSAINCHTSQPIDKILDNFVGREVIEKQGTSLYRIKVGLFKEWLLAHQ